MMRTNKDHEPRPKNRYPQPTRITYSTEGAIILQKPRPRKIDFFRVLQRRRSARHLASLTGQQLSDFLGFAIRTIEVRLESTGLMWQHRASASAGGIHPIDTFVLNFPFGNEAIYYYDPLGHTLKALSAKYSKPLRPLRRYALSMKEEPEAVLIWFAAQGHLTAAKYHNPQSLIWRDSGCVIMTSYMVATALGIKCCALGITGNRYFSKIGKKNYSLEGVGGLILGV